MRNSEKISLGVSPKKVPATPSLGTGKKSFNLGEDLGASSGSTKRGSRIGLGLGKGTSYPKRATLGPQDFQKLIAGKKVPAPSKSPSGEKKDKD